MARASMRRFVWDVPTRIFHWSIVLLMGLSWWTAQTQRMEWHYWSGLAVFALIVFRILWGLIGTDTARFTQFIKGPRAVLSYIRSKKGPPAVPTLGHNPLGGWSVVVLLAIIALEVLSGLFAVDIGGVQSGPLSFLVEFDQSRAAAEFHQLMFNVLIALSGLHLFSVLFFLVVWRWNLISRMLTGYDVVPVEGTPLEATKAGLLRLIVALLVTIALTFCVISGFWIR